jgi:hypothetical protein
MCACTASAASSTLSPAGAASMTQPAGYRNSNAAHDLRSA